MSNLKRFLALTLAMLMVVGAMVTVSAKSYTDVAADADYATAVDVLSELGVVVGATTTEFNPDALVERQQMAMFIARLATAQPALFAGEAAAVYQDQTAPVYNAAIAYANANGFIKGRTATTYDGAASVTLQEAATMLSRVLGYGNKSNDAAYPYSYMVLANEIGLLAGLEEVLPTAALTRGEVAIILYNALFAPKADRELLYTPDGQDWVVSIPGGFYGETDKDGNVLPVETLITKTWKATVVDGAYIDATLKAGIKTAALDATKAVTDPVTFNKGIATTKAISFASLSKYFEEDATADDLLGVELKLIIRNGAILKLDVIGSKTTTTSASYDADNKIITVDGEKYNLASYIDKEYPTESDNCIYVYDNNQIKRVEDLSTSPYAQIADGFFSFDVINEGLATQMLVYKPLSFAKVGDDNKIVKALTAAPAGEGVVITTLNGAVKDDYIAYFYGGNKNVDVYAIAVKSDASKAVKIGNAAKTATLADGTVVSTGGTNVSGAELGAIGLNVETHVFKVDGKIISSVSKSTTETYAPKSYYKVLTTQTDTLTGEYKAKIVNNAGTTSVITITEVNGTAGATLPVGTEVVTIDGTKVYTYTSASDGNYLTKFADKYDVVDAATTFATITKSGNLFTTNTGLQFVLNDFSKIVIRAAGATDKFAVNSGKTLAGFETQTLTNVVAVIHVNEAGVKELAYLYAQSTLTDSTAIFEGAAPVTSTNLYFFISANETTADYIKYKVQKLSTGEIEEVTYTNAAASIGADSLVYEVKSSDATPAAYTYAKSTTFKLTSGYVVTADKIYTANGVKYYQWSADDDKFVVKALSDYKSGVAYTGIIVTSGDNVDYVVVDDPTATLNDEAELLEVAGEEITATGAGSAVSPKTASITLDAYLAELADTDIVASEDAVVTIYEDSDFDDDEIIDADEVDMGPDTGSTIHLFVKVTSEDTFTTVYYDIAITNPAE